MSSKAKLFLSLLFLMFSHLMFAQEEKEEALEEEIPFDAVIQSEMGGKRMKFYGNTRFNFNQAYFSNWISGGESSLTFLYGLDYNFNYSDRNGFVWDSNLLFSLGTTYISGSKFLKKADDRFEIGSLVGKQINQYWSYSGLLNIKTQSILYSRDFRVRDFHKQERNCLKIHVIHYLESFYEQLNLLNLILLLEKM